MNDQAQSPAPVQVRRLVGWIYGAACHSLFAAAVAGMILGAKDGFQKLPLELGAEVIKVNKEQLGIDLEALASRMVETMLPETVTSN